MREGASQSGQQTLQKRSSNRRSGGLSGELASRFSYMRSRISGRLVPVCQGSARGLQGAFILGRPWGPFSAHTVGGTKISFAPPCAPHSVFSGGLDGAQGGGNENLVRPTLCAGLM